MDDSQDRRRGERRKVDTRAPRERRDGPGRRIWIRRDEGDEGDEAVEVAEDRREGERRAETSRRGGDLRRKDQRRKGDRRLD